MPLLEAQRIVAGYGEAEVLHSVNIKVEEGEIVAIIGPNGAGKSTLMKAIFGLIHLKSGRVLFRGQDVTGTPPEKMVRLGLCYVPQTENVFPSLTIQENLEMGAFIRRDGLRHRLGQVLELFPDLAGRRQERAGRLSGGQRQMLALARALMLEPQALLLDEPSASLSPKMVEAIFDRIRQINRSGVAILMVEQNARHALQFSQRGYVLAMGVNRLEGKAEELLENVEVGKLYLGA